MSFEFDPDTHRPLLGLARLEAERRLDDLIDRSAGITIWLKNHPLTDTGTKRRHATRRDRLDAEADYLTARLNPVDPDGESILQPCRYSHGGCRDVVVVAEASKTGGRCLTCFEAAISGRPPERPVDRNAPGPISIGSPWGA